MGCKVAFTRDFGLRWFQAWERPTTLDKLKSKIRFKALEIYGRKVDFIQLIQVGNKYKYKVLSEDGTKEIKAKRSLCREDEFKAIKGKKMTRRSQSSSSSRGYSEHDDSSDEMEGNSSSDEEEGDEDENNLLKPNGRPWTELESLDIDRASDIRFKLESQILYSEDEGLIEFHDRGPFFYFYHFFQMKTIPKIFEAANGLMNE